ncbi:hypothetical protein JB92DRAFT_3115667 [Gautieria morchelliformis]|nr:hypothetical protein JB92DRAFT_3115667 [Gautieria morchelliformis]
MCIDQTHLTLEIDTGVKALDDKAAKMIQSVDEGKLRLDSGKLEMHGGLETLKGQSVGIKESSEQADRHIGKVARTMVWFVLRSAVPPDATAFAHWEAFLGAL